MTTKFFVPRADRASATATNSWSVWATAPTAGSGEAQRLADGAIVAVKIPKAQGKRTRNWRKARRWSARPRTRASSTSTGWAACRPSASGTRSRWSTSRR